MKHFFISPNKKAASVPGKRGDCMKKLISEAGIVFPEEMEKETLDFLNTASHFPAEYSGYLFFPIGTGYFVCADTEAGRRIADLVSENLKQPEESVLSLKDAYKVIIRSNDSQKISSVIRRFGIPEHQNRCVILFKRYAAQKNALSELITEIAPENPGEVIVEIDHETSAFIRNTNPDEITMAAEEAGVALAAGIGRIKDTCYHLRDSLKEAKNALLIGERFRHTGSVHIYDEQILERLLISVPPQARKEFFLETVSNELSEKVINSDMRQTVQVFFENDLNMSNTARKLFMHRNTLAYKFDRIQQLTGLDPRSFRDAVILRILFELKEIEKETETR